MIEGGALGDDAYIEGYLPLALNVIKQSVHDRKKGHVLVSGYNTPLVVLHLRGNWDRHLSGEFLVKLAKGIAT